MSQRLLSRAFFCAFHYRRKRGAMASSNNNAGVRPTLSHGPCPRGPDPTFVERGNLPAPNEGAHAIAPDELSRRPQAFRPQTDGERAPGTLGAADSRSSSSCRALCGTSYGREKSPLPALTCNADKALSSVIARDILTFWAMHLKASPLRVALHEVHVVVEDVVAYLRAGDEDVFHTLCFVCCLFGLSRTIDVFMLLRRSPRAPTGAFLCAVLFERLQGS